MKIGFIGSGNMAGAVMTGMVSGGLLPPQEIAFFDVSEERREQWEQAGYVYLPSPLIAAECPYVFFGVKPQMIQTVVEEIRPYVRRETVFISIMAGISATYLKELLGFDAKVVTVMPNLPLQVGYGATAMTRVPPVEDQEFDFVKQVFSCAGIAEEVPGDKLNETIGIQGSTPAFLFRFAKCVVDFAQEKGIDGDVALRLFAQTMIGSANMMLHSGKSLEEMIRMVSSPGGTTLEGLAAMDEGHFDQTMEKTVEASVRRAYELGK